MKKTKQRTVIILLAAAAIALLAVFFSSILIPFISHQLRGDYHGARDILLDKGVLGLIAVPLIEALQMIVVFIPAEFIQISSGLAFSWRFAIPLCSFGIFLGASAIYALVKIWNFDVGRGREKIERLEKGSTRAGIYPFLTLLFFMPVIPFGAICYFGATRKNIRYFPYVLTCVLSSLPSVITSNVMGLGVRLFLMDRIPFWALLLIILAGMALLFILISALLYRLYFKPFQGTPDSPWYDIFYRVGLCFSHLITKLRFDLNGWTLPEGPALYVCNHPSALDVITLMRLVWPGRIVTIANEYVMRKGFLKYFCTQIGMIPKKLFVDEGGVVLKAKRTLKNGYSIFLCPEGRLSLDGETNPIIPSTGAFARFLNVPLVLLHIQGAHMVKPKWRPFFLRGKVCAKVEAVIAPEELRAMTPEAVNARIREALRHDEFAYIKEQGLRYRSARKAKGLPNLIYRCPVCGELYALKAAGNRLQCGACGLSLELDPQYHFKPNPAGIETISDLYHALEARERAEAPLLEAAVRVKRFRGEEEASGSGVTRLSAEGFSFTGTVAGEEIAFTLSPPAFKALPFSCGEEFETYWQGDLYYFYPETHREQCARWALLADILCEAQYEEEK